MADVFAKCTPAVAVFVCKMCIAPFFQRNKLGISIPVPCGKCPECLANRKQQWYLRLKAEHSSCRNPSYFVTLTYDDDNLPIDENGNNYVSKVDCQKFFKRLRFYLDRKFRFYLGAEYGPQTLRAHYHFVIFDIPLDVDLYAMLQKAWPYGFITMDVVNDNRLGYVAKYINSKTVIPSDFVKPFSLMSKGLGICYIDKYKEYHRADVLNRSYVMDNSVKCAMPRYYKDKIYSQWNKDRLFRQSEVVRFDKEKRKLEKYVHDHPDDVSHFFDLQQQEKLEKVRKFRKKLLQNGKI